MTDLHIATPCHESWDGMAARPEGRHCTACEQTVIDLSRLAPEAFAPVLQRVQDRIAAGDRVCIRAPVDAQGVLQAPARRRRRRLLANGPAGIIAMALAGCQGSGPDLAAPAPPAPMTRTTAGPASIPSDARPSQGQPAIAPPDHVVLQPGAALPPDDSPSGSTVSSPGASPLVPPPAGRHYFRLGCCSSTPTVQPDEPPLPRERL